MYILVYIDPMKNVQITIDDETLTRVDRVAKPLGLNRSEIVRQALRQWLRRQAVENFEREWIAALQKRPDEEARADDWIDIQMWSRK
jgi:metal-responsive CopG/Arc/MetJ family transcriptional regulator